VALSPDGRYAAAGDDDGFVRLWDLSGPAPQPRPVPRWHQNRVAWLEFVPDGKTLVSTDYQCGMVLWDVAAGDRRREWQFPGRVQAAAFAPDGRHLATANVNGTVYVLRLAKP
jgi:WD40 repeat protein